MNQQETIKSQYDYVPQNETNNVQSIFQSPEQTFKEFLGDMNSYDSYHDPVGRCSQNVSQYFKFYVLAIFVFYIPVALLNFKFFLAESALNFSIYFFGAKFGQLTKRVDPFYKALVYCLVLILFTYPTKDFIVWCFTAASISGSYLHALTRKAENETTDLEFEYVD
ncbi:hypothetical protein EIN_283720 [Entamoeba invadens IP1]|uniref:PRA1 family protein n=1 Tax=Entamoeba invadens IP1 TaxID=370355 RepID=L7FJN3_ENTIV|nr:hypothetical protein EIN_283720 [Entamoeba invadens IP1]ELP84826.1 hypothetical protein EIN_283720 [Entamoeba invadens IP1]|eukprot:XP_004184172.1 hypothetical protein EIN_283720 [Entamoeba invadens IP1]